MNDPRRHHQGVGAECDPTSEGVKHKTGRTLNMKSALLITAALVAIVAIAAGAVLAAGNLRTLIDRDYNARQQERQSHSEPTSRPDRSGESRLADNVGRLARILNFGGQNGHVAANIASTSPEDAIKRLGNLPVRKGAEPNLPPFNSEEWGEWLDLNGDCRNTSTDILQRESLTKVQFLNPCTVSTGKWVDPWSGKTFTYTSELVVAHHVPLEDAHYSGAHAWSKEKKQQYYNDAQLPVALNVVGRLDHVARRSAGPERWKPNLANRHCVYAVGWVAVKSKHGLSVTPPERNALADMLRTCPKSR